MNDKKHKKRLGFAIFSMILGISALLSIEQNSMAISPYDSGYNHGCSDAHGGNYINEPGHGPAFHTPEFMRGYNDGYAACHTNAPGKQQFAPGSWTLTIHFSNIPFGTSTIHTETDGPFGYKHYYQTQNGPNPSAVIRMFDSAFPSGYQYKICVDRGGFLPDRNCRSFIHGNSDESISMDVP